MKALTLWQPWAQLVAIGAKRYETRSWGTEYRGLLAIHAAKATGHMHLVDEEPFASALCIPSNVGRSDPSDLPMGAVIALVRLVDICPVEEILDLLEDDERAFGDFSPGRKAWELELLWKYFHPIPARGRQGLWDWEIPPFGVGIREEAWRVT